MKVLEKVERRLGEKLFLKGERCLSQKCAQVRKPYPPGVHGKKRFRGGSEYSELLKEKQKLRFLYGLDNKNLKKYFIKARTAKGDLESNLIGFLEHRLDNAVYRLGFAVSRSIARQLVSHGHIAVNDKAVNIPSYLVGTGDKIGINPSSKDSIFFNDLEARFKKYEPPLWMALDKEKISGEIKRKVSKEDVVIVPDISSIIEFYSRQ